MKKLFIPLVVMFSMTVKSQKVYVVNYQNQADIKVFVVPYQNQADLKVHKVSTIDRAGDNDGRWFFTKTPDMAKKKIYFVKNRSEADLIISFEKNWGNAGWRNKSKQHLLY